MYLCDRPHLILKWFVEYENGKHISPTTEITFFFCSGIYYASQFLKDPSLWSRLSSDWPMLSSVLLLNKSADEFRDADASIIEKIKAFYLGESGGFGEDNVEKLIQMFGDAFCHGGKRKLVFVVSTTHFIVLIVVFA